jgi:hypothetical protein
MIPKTRMRIVHRHIPSPEKTFRIGYRTPSARGLPRALIAGISIETLYHKNRGDPQGFLKEKAPPFL